MAEQKEKKQRKKKPRKKPRASAVLLLIAVLVGVWWFNNYTVKVVSTEYHSKKITAPMRIAILADLHATMYALSNETLISKVSDADPDMVVILGDMYTRKSPWELIQIPIDLTRGLVQKGYPVYYVTGDHDTSEEYKKAISDLGAHLMNYKEEITEINGNRLQIMGIDNAYFSPTFDLNKEFSAREDCFSILLAHIPNYNAYSKFGADLDLCADTHGGMIQFPFGFGPVIDSSTMTWFPEFLGDGVYYDKGWFDCGKGKMFITSGLGASPAPVRLNNRPEIVIMDILPE